MGAARPDVGGSDVLLALGVGDGVALVVERRRIEGALVRGRAGGRLSTRGDVDHGAERDVADGRDVRVAVDVHVRVVLEVEDSVREAGCASVLDDVLPDVRGVGYRTRTAAARERLELVGANVPRG